MLCVFAYAAHLACDAITGGVALFWPFGRTIWGGQWLPFWAWTVSDVGFTLWAYFVYRWVPLRRGLRKATEKTDRIF
jgi:membrane protein implicated in regulation of membrane protease activity